MYTESDKGFTVITNFGCDQHCAYCISRHHPILRDRQTDVDGIDWEYLEECVAASGAPTVNLSGGGDPLYHWQERRGFYERMHDMAGRHGKRLDVHTRVLPDDPSLVSLFRKMAVSVEYYDRGAMERLRAAYPMLREHTAIRAVQVVDSRITEAQCREYIDEVKGIGVPQVTFRQMFGNRKAYEHFGELAGKDWGEGVLFLRDGEYHDYYFTTTNEMHPYFFGDSEEDRRHWMRLYEEIEQSCN